MTHETLNLLVAQDESEALEFKKSTGEVKGGTQTCTAFLNGKGGTLLYGVKDDGTVQGQDVSDATRRELAHHLQQIEPFVPLQPEEVVLPNGRRVVAISVPAGANGPYVYDGRPYVRQANTTIRMPQPDYERRLAERMHPTVRWESQTAVGVSVAQLDATEITRTIEEGIRRGRLTEPGTRDPLTLLRHLHLLDANGSPLNAAVVLFGTSDALLPTFPQLLLRLARFSGSTMDVFVDNQQVRGHLFALLTSAQQFLQRHLPVAGRIVPALFERADDPLYPPEALREALANAFCHRDYSLSGGAVDVAVFDDRLEITSAGRLPFGLTPADLVEPHTSQPWNPLVARVLYLRGVIESWGRGTLKMIELTRRADLVAPQFEEITGALRVRFRPLRYASTDALSPLQRGILDALAAGAASLSELQKVFPDAPPTQVRRALVDLRNRNLVEVEGLGRGARWFRR